ncbi:MAG: riboflavin synthase [Luteitalea sp.]|nr:riboflavin synthase [Luteitalea sp.]
MFTGLIEAVGELVAREIFQHGERLHITAPIAGELSVGDSIATSGVCLTVTALTSSAWSVDVSPETLRVTTLGQIEPGRLVNLERPLRVGGSFGGHFVQGHVDGVGRLLGVVEEGDFHRITVSYPAVLAPFMVSKGAIAVDGVSLTIADLRNGEFDAQLVPHTWRATALQRARTGDAVNLECDMLGKYVIRFLELRAP